MQKTRASIGKLDGHDDKAGPECDWRNLSKATRTNMQTDGDGDRDRDRDADRETETDRQIFKHMHM